MLALGSNRPGFPAKCVLFFSQIAKKPPPRPLPQCMIRLHGGVGKEVLKGRGPTAPEPVAKPEAPALHRGDALRVFTTTIKY